MHADESLSSWWTGRYPAYGTCPGVDQHGKIRSLPLPSLHTCTRQQVMDYFDNTWTLTEVLFSALNVNDAFYRQPHHHLKHPLIFYYCYPAVFYVNKLRKAGLLHEAINSRFEQLFEKDIDETAWEDFAKNNLNWPAISEVTTYRRQVYDAIKKVIDMHAGFEKLPITQESPLWALFMAFENERFYLEISSVLIRELPIQFIRKPLQWPDHFPLVTVSTTSPVATLDYPSNEFMKVKKREVNIGKRRNVPSFGWDNQYGNLTKPIMDFRATKYCISNGEFREFVLAGGYQNSSYWSAEGWQWRTIHDAICPAYWILHGSTGLHQYNLRIHFEVIPMQWSWPAEVNYHEAKAYCKWLTEKEQSYIPFRLLTESEHHCLRDKMILDPVMLYSGHDMQNKKINLNLAYGSSCPVNAMHATKSGFYDVFGNVRQWCEDHFCALPEFATDRYCDDFSTPYFDGKHQILMGGSFMSTGNEASLYSRSYLKPHHIRHASFRVVHPLENVDDLETTCIDGPPPHVNSKPCCSKIKLGQQRSLYETTDILNQYLLLHYGNKPETGDYVPDNAIQFPKQCAERLIQTAKELNISTSRALDLGCAVGGAAFELSKEFEEVVGIDFSGLFIQTARTLKNNGKITYSRKNEGELYSMMEASLDEDVDASRVIFEMGDACALSVETGNFDAVLLANVLCRLPDPTSCLIRMSGPIGLVRVGGLLFITTPYSWLSAYTPSDAWLGGNKKDISDPSSYAGLRRILDKNFELLFEEDMPFVIREHSRQYNLVIAHATCWRREL